LPITTHILQALVIEPLEPLLDAAGRPGIIEPFALERFHEDKLVSELAADAVSH
jgi:hypothetical protein